MSTGLGFPVRKAWESFRISNGNPMILKMPGRYASQGTQVREKSRSKRRMLLWWTVSLQPGSQTDSSSFKLFLSCSRSQQPEKVTKFWTDKLTRMRIPTFFGSRWLHEPQMPDAGLQGIVLAMIGSTFSLVLQKYLVQKYLLCAIIIWWYITWFYFITAHLRDCL